ncbi:transposon TX1, partial [Tanacetum coccineum]
MLFKKHGVVYDMFMVQKRLRNGQRYGFVGFKNIIDVEDLLRKLWNIKIGNENLRVYLAYDRRTKKRDGWTRNRMSTGDAKRSGETLGNGTKVPGEYSVRMMDKRFEVCDNRRYNDVVNGKKHTTWYGKKDYEENPVPKENRVIKIGAGDIDTELLSRDLIGEVKKFSFSEKLPEMCKMMGLENVKIKLMGGLEIMVIFDKEETVKNILLDTNHGIRMESVFKRIAEWHGIVFEMNNCKLEGKVFKVMVKEEIRDVVECKFDEKKSVQEPENEKANSKGVDHMKEDNDENGTNEEDREDDDYEGNGETEDSNGDNNGRGGDCSGTRVRREGYKNQGVQYDKGSMVSSKIKIKDTFEDENDISYAKAADGTPKTYKDVIRTRVNLEKDLLKKDDEKVTKSKSEIRIINNYVEDGTKRLDSPPIVFGNEGVMFQKKRKIADDGDFEGNNYGILFSYGINDNKESTKKMVGRRSYCKAKKVARSANTTGNADDGEENKQVLSDNYKVFYEIKESDSVLKTFGEIDKEDSKVSTCSISEEMVREIGEQIGVTWTTSDEATNGAKMNKGQDKGIGVEGKLGWVKSIIREERLDVIGLQETKSGSIEESLVEETSLWDRLARLIERKSGAWCIFGDFNIVRRFDARINSHVNVKEMDEFNEFINVTRLVAIPIGGSKFTRVSDDGLKFSKLDQFLMNEKFKNLWVNISVVALDQKLSNHCPIVLKDMDLDFGPKPFRFFDIWLDEVNIDQVVVNAWNKTVRGSRANCRFMDKLKNVKMDLKVWSKSRFGAHNEKLREYEREALKWELEAENRHLSDIEMDSWMEARRLWVEKVKEKASMLRQKSRITWDVEGDENTKFFHAYVKRRNNKNCSRGLMVDGMWSEVTNVIKMEVFNIYRNIFTNGSRPRPKCNNRDLS